jgi:hypothetical protein
VKTVAAIALKTGLSRLRVLQEGRHLFRRGIVRQTKKDGGTAYEMIDFFHAHKKQIMAFAAEPKKLAKLATKRKTITFLPKLVTISSAGAKVHRITVDDICSFARVRKVKVAGPLPSTMSEAQFKRGIQTLIGEPGKFRDWGGERSDLYTTRIKLTAKRPAAAFAFKGPGEKGKLVPGRMGKNGDQAQRLFQEDADVFIVQHWREINSTVIDLMRSLAVAMAVTTGKRIWYGVLDGHDSQRLCQAYPSCFVKHRRK